VDVIETRLPGVLVLQPQVHGDARGFFVETFRADLFASAIPGVDFVQDNHSRSTRGVLRGMHLQWRRPQGKLVRCSRGRIFDVAVDVRPDSPTFGQWVGAMLDDDNLRQMYIPPGFAHGFQVMSDMADVSYKCTDYYDPGGEAGLRWDDPEVSIEWPIDAPELSVKDQQLPRLDALREALRKLDVDPGNPVC